MARELTGEHFGVDEYQLETRDHRYVENVPEQRPQLPSKKVPGYGDQAITLEEWRASQ